MAPSAETTPAPRNRLLAALPPGNRCVDAYGSCFG
jgi:hypothetical protein